MKTDRWFKIMLVTLSVFCAGGFSADAKDKMIQIKGSLPQK